MNNTSRAFLRTEGKTEHHGFEVGYYTYNMENKPKKFHVNVNVTMRHGQNEYTISLPLDKSFTKEEEAIKYGIAQGEKYIDDEVKKNKISS